MQCLVKEFGADPNRADFAGWTPLHIAVQNGRLSVVHCLVKELGADVNQATVSGATPLMIASAHKHTEIVVWLSKHGADAQVLHQNGGTAADVSRQRGAPVEQTVPGGACSMR
jgi:ankyrin repeat protein